MVLMTMSTWLKDGNLSKFTIICESVRLCDKVQEFSRERASIPCWGRGEEEEGLEEEEEG